ncbi:MAG: hypothetical protein LBS69_08865 [Prevotellaceae bacterium]|jgi:hypothetical protein|nr:hypothetical protein [Prevotellaceae bacterium]
MKKNIIIYISLLFLFNSCSNDINENDNINISEQISSFPDGNITVKSSGGTPRLVFSSTEQVGNTMEQLIAGKKLKEIVPEIKIKEIKPSNLMVLQSAITSTDSTENEAFLSYAEYLKSEFLANLPADKRALLESDSDFESFRIVDDIDIEPENDSDTTMHLAIMPIVDYQFTSILNPKKEIQVGTKIYKYTDKGIVVVDEEYASVLDSVDIYLKEITVEPNTTDEMILMSLAPHATLIMLPIDDGYSGGGGSSGGGSSSTPPWAPGYTPPSPPLVLTSVNQTIPASSIREVDFSTSGDGSWMNWVGNIFGKKVIAINKFNGHKRLKLSFYDRNYLIYHRIGAEIEMQKKFMSLIWINTHAEDVVLGFTGAELKAEYYHRIEDGLPKKNNQTIYPLFKSPFVTSNYMIYTSDFDFVTRDMEKVFKTMYRLALTAVKPALKQLLGFFVNENGDPRISVYGIQNKDMFVVTRPNEETRHHVRSYDKNLHFQMWSGYVEFVIDLDEVSKGNYNPFQTIAFKVHNWKELSLHRGQTYGAVKYNGVWKAARITKYQ